jgi:hypothetical protein
MILLAVSLTLGCRTRELNDPPGFSMSFPDDVPKLCRRANGKAEEGTHQTHSRPIYEYGYREGWRNYFTRWQFNEVDLAEPIPPMPLPESPTDGEVQHRGERDGFEECRKMLLQNGAARP